MVVVMNMMRCTCRIFLDMLKDNVGVVVESRELYSEEEAVRVAEV